MSSGMRWAETTLASKAMPNSVRMSAAWRITSQSLLEPITTPTWMALGLDGFWVWGDVLTAGSCLVKGRILARARPGAPHLPRLISPCDRTMIDITYENFEADLIAASTRQ